jgi:hypothetical protein
VGDDVLHLGRMLRRAVEVDAPVFLGQRVGDLPLEIELLLSADVELAAHPARGGGHRRVGVARRRCIGGSTYELQALRFLRVSTPGQDVVVDLGEPGGAPRGIVRRGDHDEHRLADVLDEPVGEYRVVVDDRPAIVLPGMSAAVSTATTSGAARTAARSIDRMRACAFSDSPSAAWRVPAISGISST